MLFIENPEINIKKLWVASFRQGGQAASLAIYKLMLFYKK